MTAALDLLKDSPALGPLAPAHLDALARLASLKTFAAGETIFRQGAAAEACFLLAAGTVDMVFRPAEDSGAQGDRGMPPETVHLRQFDDPGRLLGWSALLAPFRYRATVTARKQTQLLVLERKVLDEYIDANPAFGVALLERVIWILGNRLRETRIRLVARRYEREIMAIRALLDQSAELLHVDSPLHKIPYYLENRLTIADAFQALEHDRANGDAQ